MRARYYEPATGRFVSEDPGRHGANWFQYCNGNPMAAGDWTAENPFLIAIGVAFLLAFLVGSVWDFMTQYQTKGPGKIDYIHSLVVGAIAGALSAGAVALVVSGTVGAGMGGILMGLATTMTGEEIGLACLTAVGFGGLGGLMQGGYESIAAQGVTSELGHNLQIEFALLALDYDS